jgi:hypothetical protein
MSATVYRPGPFAATYFVTSHTLWRITALLETTAEASYILGTPAVWVPRTV